MNFINIEDIMMRNQELVVENQALRLRIEDLKNGFEGSCMACEPVGEMNKKLRDERDEARLEVRVLQRKLKETQKELSNYAMDRIAKFDEENGLI